MAHNPTDIGSCPEDVAGINTVDVLHRPLQGHEMPAVVTNHALRLPGGAGGIQDVEGIRGGHWNALMWLCRICDFIPVAVAVRHECRALHLTLKNYTPVRFVPGDSKRVVEERFVGDYSVYLHPA